MREVIIIEKNELVGLSVLIAERIIADSKRAYGFTMVSRDGEKWLNEDMMLGLLAPSIRKALQGREKGLKIDCLSQKRE